MYVYTLLFCPRPIFRKLPNALKTKTHVEPVGKFSEQKGNNVTYSHSGVKNCLVGRGKHCSKQERNCIVRLRSQGKIKKILKKLLVAQVQWYLLPSTIRKN